MNLLYYHSSLRKLLDPNSSELGNYCPITDVQCLTRTEASEPKWCALYDVFDFEKREEWVAPDPPILLDLKVLDIAYHFVKTVVLAEPNIMIALVLVYWELI